MARAIGMANGAALMISFRNIRYIQARRVIFMTVFSFLELFYMALILLYMCLNEEDVFVFIHISIQPINISQSIHEEIVASYFSLAFSSADKPTTFLNVPKLKQSLIRLAPEKSITRRSTPHPQPPVGGRP